MLRHRSSKERLLSRIAFYSAVLALLWVLEKVDASRQVAVLPPAPAVHGFVAQHVSH